MARSQPSAAREQVRDIVPGLIDLSVNRPATIMAAIVPSPRGAITQPAVSTG